MNKEININNKIQAYSGDIEIAGSGRSAARGNKTRKREVTYITGKDRSSNGVSFGAMFTVCLFCIVFMFVALLNVRINEVSGDIASLQDELAEVRLEKAEVSALLSEKNDLGLIRELAEGYGMVPASQLPTRHVTVNSADEITVLAKNEESGKGTISTLLDAFGASFEMFVEYLR